MRFLFPYRGPTSADIRPRPEFPEIRGRLGARRLRAPALGCVKPRGWLLEQLRGQADGLSGHIEEVWPDLGPDNAWRGGKGEAWERGPYYLDGMVPLAFLLDDPVLIAKVQAWMDWNLEHQALDGSIGPRRTGDWWPDMVFLKALLQYGEASGDERVGPYLDRYFQYLKNSLPAQRLDAWRSSRRYDEQAAGAEDLVGESNRWQYYRWTEMVLDLLSRYRQSPSGDLLQTAEDLRSQGFDWEENFKHLPFTEKSGRDQVFLVNHGVNNAMGMKADALDRLLGAGPAALPGVADPLRTLMRWHGQANGAFSADEQLAGLDPSQGTELCCVVEEMYSLETMLWVSGDPALADALERLAFNALPAALSADSWRHQYDQQVNQIEVSDAPRAWTNNGPQANLFGLAPEWGCCTANYHQGWPKFVEHLWMATPEGGLAVLSYAPSHLDLRLPSGRRLDAETRGSYPFSGDVEISLSGLDGDEFPLSLRIPSWFEGGSVKVAGQAYAAKAGAFVRILRRWKDGDLVSIHFKLPTRVRAWGPGAVLERGPLLLAMDITPRPSRRGQDPWSDEELFPVDPWNLAPLVKVGDDLTKLVQVASDPSSGVFDRASPPVSLRLPARRVDNWERVDNSAGPLPPSPQLGGPTRQALFIPYAAAKLRITVFPRAIE